MVVLTDELSSMLTLTQKVSGEEHNSHVKKSNLNTDQDAKQRWCVCLIDLLAGLPAGVSICRSVRWSVCLAMSTHTLDNLDWCQRLTSTQFSACRVNQCATIIVMTSIFLSISILPRPLIPILYKQEIVQSKKTLPRSTINLIILFKKCVVHFLKSRITSLARSRLKAQCHKSAT